MQRSELDQINVIRDTVAGIIFWRTPQNFLEEYQAERAEIEKLCPGYCQRKSFFLAYMMAAKQPWQPCGMLFTPQNLL